MRYYVRDKRRSPHVAVLWLTPGGVGSASALDEAWLLNDQDTPPGEVVGKAIDGVVVPEGAARALESQHGRGTDALKAALDALEAGG